MNASTKQRILGKENFPTRINICKQAVVVQSQPLLSLDHSSMSDSTLNIRWSPNYHVLINIYESSPHCQEYWLVSVSLQCSMIIKQDFPERKQIMTHIMLLHHFVLLSQHHFIQKYMGLAVITTENSTMKCNLKQYYFANSSKFCATIGQICPLFFLLFSRWDDAPSCCQTPAWHVHN